MSVTRDFNIFNHVVDFSNKVQFKTGAEVRTFMLNMLSKPEGQMAFAQSMLWTRRNTPNFGVRLNDIEGLFDGQSLVGLPLDKGDLSGTIMTPESIRQTDLFGTKADGIQIKAHVISDVRTDEHTSLRGAVIKADIISDLVLAPGSDCRDIEIRTGKTYMGNDANLTGSIEGALLQGARLPADLSTVKGTEEIGRHSGLKDRRFLINGGDGIYISSQYGLEIIELGAAFKQMANDVMHGRDDVRMLDSIVDHLAHSQPKDWPHAAAARDAIRTVQADPQISRRVEFGRMMPPEKDIVLAVVEPSNVVAPEAFRKQ